MTIALEHTADSNPAIDRNFEKLKTLVIDTGGVSVSQRAGSQVVTWPGGSPITNTATVTHGLDHAPTSIMLSSSDNSNPGYSNITATTFDITARTVDGSLPGAGSTTGVSWQVWG